MVRIAPFEVERWLDTHETTAKYNIADTCAASISLEDLAKLADTKPEAALLPTAKKLVYGEVRGSTELRNNLAALYSARASSLIDKEDILIMPGAIAANFLVLQTLIGPGDHVICHYPTYEQLINVPRALGAETSLWKADPSQKWQLNVDELRKMIKPESTKLIVLNNPNNPTGAIIPKSSLESIISIAREHKIVILSDEVYRPIFHSIGPMDDDFPPSAINLGYNNVIVTGSLSKAYSLAGIRVGWMACRNKGIIEACAEMRHYNTISVSLLDQAVAAEALNERCIHALLARNIQLAKTNLAILESFVEDHRWACSWIPPLAGTTAFVKFVRNGKPIDDEAFCESVQEKAGVMFVPGSRCFGKKNDFKGYVRVGFVQETQTLKEGLAALAKFMEDEYESVPIASKS